METESLKGSLLLILQDYDKLRIFRNIFYIGTNGILQRLSYSTNAWNTSSINSFFSGIYKTARSDSKLAITFPNGYAKIHYIGSDNFLHYVLWTNNGWSTGKLCANSSIVKAGSSLVADIYGKIYFVNTNDKIVAAYNVSGTNWQEAILSPSINVRANSDLVIDENSKLYYIGSDNKIHYLISVSNIWQDALVNSAASTCKLSTNFTYNNGNLIYPASNNILQSIYWDGCKWNYTQLNGLASNYQNISNWSTQYINNKYQSSFYFDNSGKLHKLTPKIDVYTNPFVYVKEDKLMLNNSQYYVKGMNYYMDFNLDTKPGSRYLGQYFMSRYNKHCGCCYGRCNNNPSQALAEINTDFQRLSSLGFNTIRIAGGFQLGGDSLCSSADNDLYFSVYEDYDYGPQYGWGVSENKKKMDQNYLAICLTQFDKVLLAAANNNLKVILLTGFGRINKVQLHSAYINFVSQIANHYKNNPALLGIDICNEPSYDKPCNVSKQNCEVSNLTYNLYQSVRQTGSKTLLTMGLLNPSTIFDWDAKMITVDFHSPHIYTLPEQENFNNINVKSDIYYWSKVFKGKPWVIGEYGFSSNMYNPLNLKSHPQLQARGQGTLAQQFAFASDVTNTINDLGGSGGLWWNYKDAYGSGAVKDSGRLDFYGIYAAQNNQWPSYINTEVLKTYNGQSLASILTQVTPNCNPSNFVVPITYYNYVFPLSTNTYSITGNILDQNALPIEDAYVLAYPPSVNISVEFTYSKANGTFNIQTPYPPITLGISAPGYSIDNILITQPLSTSGVNILNQNVFLEKLNCNVLNKTSNTSLALANLEANRKPTEQEIMIYPNPNDGNFRIKCFNLGSKINLNVVNSKGEIVETVLDFNESKTINLLGLAKGLYLVKLSNTSGLILTKKFIIE